MRLFKKKKGHEDTVTFARKYKLSKDVFLKIDDTLVKVNLMPKQSIEVEDCETIYIDYYDIEDILYQIQQVRDALLIEEKGGESSGAFTISPKSYLEIDYHSLTMMGEEFDKRVRKVKKKL